ncbi:N-acetylmannosamine-6-phosphate 2-epimerase [Propioniciclava soli]|uniref:N-acetylmannosamine-6-phosphate 2-epimerase n=1 Tax=Propioniciclava soli TaxID=2775081 RepID=UPI001E4BCEA3|nr:N-acetylmannosamine-6-phosphate 2-epimerase [Propioniciclava soli]
MTVDLEALRGGVVVSCQAYPGEPMLDPRTMAQVAQAAVAGGAVGIRGKGLDDLRAMRPVLSVPLIGLVKVGDSGVYITPTLDDCLAVADTGVEVVALDGTRRPRPDGLSFARTVTELKNRFPDVLVMADCGSADDAAAAQDAGADILGTTLAGYTGERPKTDGPDWECIDEVVALASVPVFVEGRIHTPAQAARAIRHGAWAVVVGTAITHPTTLTGWFTEAVASA